MMDNIDELIERLRLRAPAGSVEDKAAHALKTLRRQLAESENLRKGVEFGFDVANEQAQKLTEQLAAAQLQIKTLRDWIFANSMHDDSCDALGLDENGLHCACSCGLTDALSTPQDLSALRELIEKEMEPVIKQRDELLAALEFYAEGHHFILHDANAWETVSGEPQNFQEDEANTATVEDGSVAKAAIASVKGGAA